MRDLIRCRSPRSYTPYLFCFAVRNYDYIVTYKFKLDGHFASRLDPQDIQSHYMPLDRQFRFYGVSSPQLHGGSVHDHTFGFKVDLDVGGETTHS
jgi:Cu2+-containing amine oxidase